MRWLWSCLAPTMACALLTLMAFSHEGAGLGRQLPIALVLSNQDSVVYATATAETAQNHLATVTFDSTNRSVLDCGGALVRTDRPATPQAP